MPFRLNVLAFTLFSLFASSTAQTNPAPTTGQVPRFVRFGATIKDANGNPMTGPMSLTFSLYVNQVGGTPLWQETQDLVLDANGRYSAVLGSTQPNGLPVALFVSGEAQWLGVQPQGQAEQPRVMMVSAPYALKAGDSETVGGYPPSAFMLAPSSEWTTPEAATAYPSSASDLGPSRFPMLQGHGKSVPPIPDYGNGVIYASTLPGTGNGDIGDRVMQAYTQYCLAGGCRIRIAPDSTGGCWSYSTPINFNVVGKPVTLEGDPGGASCIQFTPTTGNAIDLDWGTSHDFGAGVRDLTILGDCTANSNGVPNCTGVTSQGIVIGLQNGCDGFYISNVNVGRSGAGFLNGFVDTGVALITGFLGEYINDTADGNGTGVLISAFLENTRWMGGSISGNSIGLSVTNGNSDVGFDYVSFDANAVCAVSITTNADLTLRSDHFESPSLGTNCWLTGNNGNVVWAWGDIFDDVSSGEGNPPITFGGTSFVFDHVPVVTAGRSVPEIIDFTGNTLAWLTPFNKNYTAQPLDYKYTGTPGRVFYLPLYGPSVEVPADMSFYAMSMDSLALGGGQKISNSSNLAQFVGTILTTNAASNNVSLTGLTTAGHCSAQATNSIAAGLTGVYIVTISGGATLFHSAKAGGTFNIFCSFD